MCHLSIYNWMTNIGNRLYGQVLDLTYFTTTLYSQSKEEAAPYEEIMSVCQVAWNESKQFKLRPAMLLNHGTIANWK